MLEDSGLVAVQLVFQAPPVNFNPKLEVIACFIAVEDKFLFMKRQPHKSEGSLWGIPGGRLEKGETIEAGVIRETQEETGIDLTQQPLKYLGKVYIRYPEVDFIYHMFACDLKDYPAKILVDPREHTEYRWMTLADSLKLPLIRGEAECIYLAYGSDLKG